MSMFSTVSSNERLARDRRLEGIEIGDEEIDAVDAVLLHRRRVSGLVAQARRPP